MSRFGNLEFDGHSERAREETSLVRDEAYYLSEAGGLFQRGRFEPALRAFSKALEFNPKSPGAWIGQIRMLIELNEFEEARLWADKALILLPDNPELLAAKGVALARTGDLAGAISFSDAAIETPGNSPYIWLARGDVLLARKEKRADYCFEKALSFGGGKWIWNWLAARVQTYYHHFAKALKLLQDALALSPAEAVLWLELGRAQLALGLTAQARRAFEQVSELDPELDISHAEDAVRQTSFWNKMTRRLGGFFTK